MLAKKLQSAAKAVEPVYVEDVYSTFLYTGNGSTQTITNGIDLAGKGGLVWIKDRGATGQDHNLVDTVRGATNQLNTNNTSAQVTNIYGITGFTSSGWQMNNAYDSGYNGPGYNLASWTFRKQPKFFDVVTYTGDNTAGRTVAHSLGSVPGCIIVKQLNGTNPWFVYHRSLGASKHLRLNTTNAELSTDNPWNNTSPTSTVFTLGDGGAVNGPGGTYVAYLFAHDAGGFGLTGTDNVISCGSFTTDGSGNATVTLGWEPQWVLFKRTSSAGDWFTLDSMRGFLAAGGNSNGLSPNTSGAETAYGQVGPTATGFQSNAAGNFSPSATYIYIAIRRGPMKVPTDGTKVFSLATYTGDDSALRSITTNFPVDSVWFNCRESGSFNRWTHDRLRGNSRGIRSNDTAAESDTGSNGVGVTDFASNTSLLFGGNGGFSSGINFGGQTYVEYAFRRAPGFFDEVCYTGTGSDRDVTHNLGVAPELIVIKSRSGAYGWSVGSAALPSSPYGTWGGGLFLNTDAAMTSGNFNGSTPTSTTFNINGSAPVNNSGVTYVAHLFASCPGVSKVGSYTGTGTTLQINCGFSGGARFVLIKATSTTGDWKIVDAARGLVAGNDPTLALNSTAAEVTGNDCIDPDSSGFIVNQESTNNLNVNGVSYIFLAIA